MTRAGKKRFSPTALAEFFQDQASQNIPQELDLWPQLFTQLQFLKQTERQPELEQIAAGIWLGEYEAWMEETMEPDQVWVWITCFEDYEQEAADALRKAFAAVGISDQLLDIIVAPNLGITTSKTDTAQTLAKKVRYNNLRFSRQIMAKVVQTEAVAAVLRSGPGAVPISGWWFQRVARRAREKPAQSKPEALTFKNRERVRILSWPYEGFEGQVLYFDKKNSQVLVDIPGPGLPINVYPEDLVRIVESKDRENPPRAWYVVYTYPGKEDVLRENLRKRLGQANLLGRLYDIIPAQGKDPISMVKDGEIRTVYPSLFPGAVFVLMSLDEATWNVVRQTPGLTGFVGSGNKPRAYPPASPPDVTGQNDKRKERRSPVQKEDRVRILSGPYYDFRGVVIEVDEERSTVRVMIDFFNRPTPVEVGFEQVAKE